MRQLAAACLLLVSSAALAAPKPARKQAERDLFWKIVEVPTVEKRGQMPRLTRFLSEGVSQGRDDRHHHQWNYLGKPSGIHGLDEQMPVKAFHDQIDIWEAMLRDLTGR